MISAMNYPPSKQIDQVDDYHGIQVNDPYRWLEQPADQPEVRSWIEAQNAFTAEFLQRSVKRSALQARLTELWNYPKHQPPIKKGGRYFQLRNTGLQNQDVLYVMDALHDPGDILLDPNTLSPDGTVALNTFSISPDGQYLAYSVSSGGSDWQTWRIREVASRQDLPEVLEWSKFSGATWLPDSSGFFYQRYPQPAGEGALLDANEGAALYLHHLNTAQNGDPLIYQQPDEPQWMFHTQLSDDDRYLFLYIRRSTEAKNLLYYRKLDELELKPLINSWDAEYRVIGNDGDIIYVQTDYQAERNRIIAVNLAEPAQEHWQTLIPEQADNLDWAKLIGSTLICCYLQDAKHVLRSFSLEGQPLADIALPDIGSVTIIQAERYDKEGFLSFTSFLYPSQPLRLDAQTLTLSPLNEARLPFDFDSYQTRQVFVSSKDGTRIPMFLIHHKQLEYHGQNPCLLYGYGGFNVPLTPAFSVSRLLWLEQGGILAVANLRGGGEYGRGWHEAGTKGQKQNVFDDCIACAEWLIEQNISSSDKLAVQGGSNGGLLVGAVITQRPELFGAALPAVGVLDMLRFHKFTIGWAWVSDYGSPDDAEDFPNLYAYSPLHNIRPGTTYPATLITTGDHDDRVVPAHSFKFAAALQTAQAGNKPILIRVQTKAGHGMGKPTKLIIEEQVDIWAFLTLVLSSTQA